MSFNEADKKKWICKKCTFENWPKSIKCTICLSPNSSNIYIINESNLAFNSEINHNECTSKCNISNITNNQDCISDLNKKWFCQVCTYENWPKSTKCVQCMTPCSLNQSSCSKNLIHDEKIKPKYVQNNKIEINEFNENECDLIKLNNSLNKINNISNVNKNDNLELNRENMTQIIQKTIKPSTSNDLSKKNSYDETDFTINKKKTIVTHETDSIENSKQNKLTDTFQTIGKWNCVACTYENWPKSIKCVLCSTSKPNNLTSAICSTNQFYNSVNNEPKCSEENLKASKFEDERNTPSPIEATCQRNRLNNNIINSNNVNSLINYNFSNRRKNREHVDWYWLEACVGILNGDPNPVIVYLNNGGDLARQLTHIEVNLLNRPSAFDVGFTLVHLAIRFKRSKILEILLENRVPSRAKRVPCSVSSNFAIEVRKIINNSLKQRKGDFPCFFVNEIINFSLPQEILELPSSVQERLFDELLDKDVQKELEEESSIINWSLEVNVTLGSRLYALWNRSTGDCLLDSALQATWGVFDKDNRLRKSLADSLNDAAHVLFPRFKEAETLKVNHQLPYTLDQMQWEEDWAVILSLASQPGSALEQFHIFTLAHILRRPIIVYGVKFVKSFRGETLGYAGFQGIYLPLHWDSNFCSKSPIALGYTRGHFTALVPMEAMANCVVMNCSCGENGTVTRGCSSCVAENGCGSIVKNNFDLDCCYLPLVTSERELLPLQFLIRNELGRQEELMRQYLDCCVTEGGILVAKQKISKRPFPMQQMLNEWVDFYRNIPGKNCTKKSSVDQCSNSNNTNDATNLNYLSEDDSD